MIAVTPDPIPIVIAIKTKNTGNPIDRAACASVDKSPAKKVSTTLYIVLKKKPIVAGIASCFTSFGMGSLRRLRVCIKSFNYYMKYTRYLRFGGYAVNLEQLDKLISLLWQKENHNKKELRRPRS